MESNLFLLSIKRLRSAAEFNGKNYLQTHGTAIGTKMAVSFANILMAKVKTDNL